MYDIITLEVLVPFTETNKVKIFSHDYILTTEHKAGDMITVTHSIDSHHKKLIEEGKLRLAGSVLEEKHQQ